MIRIRKFHKYSKCPLVPSAQRLVVKRGQVKFLSELVLVLCGNSSHLVNGKATVIVVFLHSHVGFHRDESAHYTVKACNNYLFIQYLRVVPKGFKILLDICCVFLIFF